MSPEAMNLAQAGLVCLCKSNSMGGYVSDARQGKARQGKARQGRAEQGRATLHSPGKALNMPPASLDCLCKSNSMHQRTEVGLSVPVLRVGLCVQLLGGGGGNPTNHAIFCQERTD